MISSTNARELINIRKTPAMDWEFWMVGLVSFIIFLATAYYLVFQLNIFLTDAMARTRSAWQVFFSSEPKMANIGFVWAPLPALLQLPLVLIPAFRNQGVSGNIVTALCGAGSVQVILLFLRQIKLPRIIMYLLLLLYVANPMILFYSSNGMSEMILELFVMLIAYYYLRWNQTHQWIYITGCGLATCLAFLSRYDASFVAAAVAIFIGLEAIFSHRKKSAYAESLILLYASPVLYVMSLWVLLNWLIMGDPLYFVRSDYSNAGQIGYQLALLPELLPLKHNIIYSLWVGFRETAGIFPFFVVISIWLAILSVMRRTWIWLGMLAISWSLMVFSTFNLFMGQSALFLRYFISAIPMAMVLLAGVLHLHAPKLRIPLALLFSLFIGGSAYFTAQAMGAHKEWGQWNDQVVQAALTNTPLNSWKDEKTLAAYILHKTTGFVMVDDFQGYRVIFFSGEPGRFLTPSDSTFKRNLRDPYKNVNYLLTSSSALEGELNQVNNAYPYLFNQGANWVQLEYQDSTWKLFKVIDRPGTIPLENSTVIELRPTS
jgi:hypothetical protein